MIILWIIKNYLFEFDKFLNGIDVEYIMKMI